MLKSLQDHSRVVRNYREEAKRVLKHTGRVDADTSVFFLGRVVVDQHIPELEEIPKTLKQVDLCNEDLRSKIMVAKRTTLDGEEDYFIDQLTEQLRELQERQAMYEMLEKETKAAIETSQDAATEMETIQFEASIAVSMEE
ncbi:hypothetical protein HK097_002189 [Rhizophlyctis rosea]|uniref:Uncharacterized protein n=1 Tax=Rhizophlyctis rosea TaxID=64517 RepID=A0AAD5WXX3_9FUNG|nr:hypothetical protein HK097_002189 [Rhizophlyctis rosea]